ncbi:MAG: glycosyltransferase family 2 protein [Candidatus Omnitrophica bacterium]|nr:glycosyltransferase family 2 protein [Candidatus Omnitrophota bacterium]MDD5553350.1 glycosyltransferase family 2 protein [Candidatus Omnitrophota bacterium]
MPEISVIIVTFNSGAFIKKCLDSVFHQDYPDLAVTVIDNGSSDGTAALVKKDYSKAALIENKENLGACRARNQGIAFMQSRWVLTLDCDVTLKEGFLKNIMAQAKNASGRLGMFQPKILRTDKKTVYSCGIVFSNLIRFDDIGKGAGDNGRFNNSKYVFGSCSAASLYKREMLEEVKEDTGYFDERFFFLAEDVDLARRAQRKGWKGLFVPEAVCYHYGNSSSSDKQLRQFFCWRNRNLILEKERLNRPKRFLFFLSYDLPRLAYLFCTNHYVRNKNLYKDAGGELARIKAQKK